MDIKALLLNHYSKSTVKKISDHAATKPAAFSQLMNIFLTGPYRLTQRATVPLELAVKQNQSLVIPFYTDLIKALINPNSDNSIKRNILRILQYVDVPKRYQGKLLALCLNLVSDNQTPIALRVFSMTVAANISYKLPGIRNELELIIRERIPYESAGFVSRAKKILKMLAQSSLHE